MDNIKRTRQLLFMRKPLFEGGFQTGNLFARVDILKPATETSWDVLEVKSSTSVKDENLYDVAFKRYYYEQAGLAIGGLGIGKKKETLLVMIPAVVFCALVTAIAGLVLSF